VEVFLNNIYWICGLSYNFSF